MMIHFDEEEETVFLEKFNLTGIQLTYDITEDKFTFPISVSSYLITMK